MVEILEAQYDPDIENAITIVTGYCEGGSIANAFDEDYRFSIPPDHTDPGCPGPPPAGAVPSFHSFRHTAASVAIAAGESAEEVAWQLGHRNSTVTRAVYIQEIKSAERTSRRRARMDAEYAALLETSTG